MINVVEQESSFSEFENEQKQVEKIVTHEQKQVEKIVTHEQKQVSRIVTHEQEQVEKVATHEHRVGGVLWRHQSHVAKRRSHMRRSHVAKQVLSVEHDMNLIALVTVDSSVKPGS